MNDISNRDRGLLACLGDASRYRIVAALAGGARCVTEIAREVTLSQSCTTRHLQAMRRAGLVRGERQGKRVMFQLREEDPRVGGLLEWMISGEGREWGWVSARVSAEPRKGFPEPGSTPPAVRLQKPGSKAPLIRPAPARGTATRPARAGSRIATGAGAEDGAEPEVEPQEGPPEAHAPGPVHRSQELEDYLL